MLGDTAIQPPMLDDPPTQFLQPPFQQLTLSSPSPKEQLTQPQPHHESSNSHSPRLQKQRQQHHLQQQQQQQQPPQEHFQYQKQRSQPKLNSQQQYILQQTQQQKQQQQQKQLKLKEYEIICAFLTQVLNLDDPKAILGTITTRSTTTHLLPNIQFPNDTWLIEDIVIKDSKIKTTLLQEINSMFEQQLIKTNSQHSHHNSNVNIDTQINYYEKLLIAYKVYNVPGKSNDNYVPPMLSLNESDENYEDQESFPSPNLDDSDVSSRKSGKKRFSMFTSHNNNNNNNNNKTNENDNATIISSTTADVNSSLSSNTTLKHNSNGEILNSILSKSKIYNKLKKRDSSSSSNNSILSSSTNGNGNIGAPTTPTLPNGPIISTPNNSNYTHSNNRNSVSSTMTASTMSSTPRSSTISNRRRISSTSDLNEARSYPNPPSINTNNNNNGQANSPYSNVPLTFQQRIDNKKEKYEYYVHLIRLYTISQRLMKQLQQGTNEIDQLKWTKYLDFIKNKLFKFIIIDVLKLVLDYGYMNSKGLIKRSQ
ncbi:hypothetical protein DFJ63DRAFT_314270 [Scheffersomyces coipomensis]|uniref:uncharacterized protein n=1 Tax=Scheffersomyces coipomensis TaxID=1788519 RepID=UPI00315D8B8B